MAKKKEQGRQAFLAEYKNRMAGITGFFALAVLVLVPLMVHEMYSDILETKYLTYWLSIVLMTALVLLVSLLYMGIDFSAYGGESVRQLFARLKPKQFFHTFSVADIAMMVFVLAAAISTLQSDYLYESFWGNEGRFTGLFLIMIYGTAFFLFGKLLRLKQWYLDAFLAAGFLVCAFGVTDYFQLDIMGWRAMMREDQRYIFTSTIGNINTYAAFSGLFLGVSATLFGTEKNRARMTWYYICVVTALLALMTALSDSAYLGMGTLFAFLPLYLFRSRIGLKRYSVMLATVFTLIKVLDIVNQLIPEQVVGLDSLFLILSEMRLLLPLIVILWAAVAALYAADAKKGPEAPAGKLPWRIWLGFLVLCFAALSAVLVDANIMGNSARYGSLGRYLVFNEDWGTHRGYIWSLCMDIYQKFPPMRKLFGCGPDTLVLIMKNEEYLFQTAERYHELYDSAHNEYIQYLVTIGAVGMTAYVTMLVGAGARMIRRGINSPAVMACFFACLCYAVQAFVNINLPITAPVMMTLLAMGLAGCREK